MAKNNKLKVKKQQLRPFGKVYFGSYPQNGENVEPIEWQVLCKIEDRVLLLSKYILYFSRFDVFSTDWNKSEIKTWLNVTFYEQAFSSSEKEKIIQDEESDSMVFILSHEQVEKYLPDKKIERVSTPYAKKQSDSIYGGCHQNYWWLRDSIKGTYQVKYIMGKLIQNHQTDSYCGVVPALWVRVKPD